MTAVKPIGSLAELYGHALAIEREAAARYDEFARFMEDHDNVPVARLFARLAGLEREHAARIEARAGTAGVPPTETWEHSWIDARAPETTAHEFLFRLMSPRDALELALAAEERARDWFERVCDASTDPQVRAFAASLAQEEGEHVAWVRRALDAEPDPNPDWERLFEGERVVLPPGRAP
jgi:rubrerythrin